MSPRPHALPAAPPPVVKRVLVAASPERAFRRFTAELAAWWPLASHSIGQEDALTVAMEPEVGGRIVETIRDREPCVWGTVTAWEPPSRVAFTWHPGKPADSAQEVVVSFAAEGERTRVTLVHSGFERLGADAKKTRGGYDLGWSWVLGVYAGKRGPFMLAMGALTDTVLWFRRRKAAREKRRAAPAST